MEEIGEDDSVYTYDSKVQNALKVAKPWMEDPTFFKKVRISGHNTHSTP